MLRRVIERSVATLKCFKPRPGSRSGHAEEGFKKTAGYEFIKGSIFSNHKLPSFKTFRTQCWKPLKLISHSYKKNHSQVCEFLFPREEFKLSCPGLTDEL